jgi:hypothetical protein
MQQCGHGQACNLAEANERATHLPLAGTLLSFGRPTYGRLGQKDAEVGSDSACPELKQVDGLEGVEVAGAAAGLAVSGQLQRDGLLLLLLLRVMAWMLCFDLWLEHLVSHHYRVAVTVQLYPASAVVWNLLAAAA